MSTPRISGITTNSKYNIFAENRDANDAVRVGYIHPRKGYISGLTVYAANTYAEANPGTQFIIANRDKVKYINKMTVPKFKKFKIEAYKPGKSNIGKIKHTFLHRQE